MPRRTPQRLELFGGPALVRDGDPVQISPYQAALLTVLFTEGRDRMPRTRVQALLWVDPEERSVRHRMSQLVYQVNRKTGGRVVEIVGESIHVHQGVVQCDLDDFEELIRRPDFVAAGEMMSRGFLSALPAPPTEAFEDWMGLKALSLRARLREKALASWAAAELEQDWSRGRAAAEAMLLLDPKDEVVLRRVMKSRAMGGLVREAEAVYLAFADRVSERGVWVPDAETRELLETVRATYTKTDPPAEVALPPRLEVPLCGRDEELAYLTRAIFQERPRNSATTVTVSGEAGLGKTRLVEEAIQGARFRGYRVLRSRPAELERNIPLNPLLEALNQPWVGPVLRGLEDPWRSVLLALMPQFHEGPGPLPEVPYVQPGSLPRRTYEAFFRLFQAVAATHRTLLFIDDAQWADETSAAVLQFMHRRWNQDNLTLVLTYRDEELEAEQPLGRFLDELTTDPQVTGIRLSELNEESARKLAESVANNRLSDDAVGEVVALAGGNPFFVIELAADYMADRGPERRGDGAPLPMPVRQMVRRRIRELDAVSRRVVSAAAVFGHPVSLAKLTRMTAFAREECVEGLENLQRLRLVEWVEVGVRCRHDIVRRAVYEDLSHARRAHLHGRIAEVLESEPGDVPKDQLALHYHRAGERDLALKYALGAADDAEVSGSNRQGIRYAEMALELARDARLKATLNRRLAMLHHRDRDLSSAEAWLRLAMSETDHTQESEVWLSLANQLVEVEAEVGTITPEQALERLTQLEFHAFERGDIASVADTYGRRLRILDRVGRIAEIGQLFEKVEALLPEATPTVACAVNCILATKVYFGSVEEAIRHGREASRLASVHELDRLRLRAYNRHILVLSQTARLHKPEGRQAVREALGWSKNSGDVLERYLIRANIGVWYLDTGDLDRAKASFLSLKTEAMESSARRPKFELSLNMGEVAVLERDFEGARDRFRNAVDLFDSSVPKHMRDLARAGLGLSLLKMGQLRAAQELKERIAPLAPVWQNDKSLLVSFVCELHAINRDWKKADALFAQQESVVEPRLPVLWTKLRLARVRMLRRSRDKQAAADLARDGHAVAAELDLTTRTSEFRRFLESA